MASQDEFLVNSPVGIRENDANGLDFALVPSRLFGLGQFGLSHPTPRVRLTRSFPNVCLINDRFSVVLYLRCAHSMMRARCRVHR